MNTNEQALTFIKLIGDRAVQRGNIFTGAAEVMTFIESFNTLVQMSQQFTQASDELKKLKADALESFMKQEGQKSVVNDGVKEVVRKN